MRRVLAIVVAATSAAVLAASAEAQGYKFTKVVDSKEGLSPDGCPAINDEGQVAFKAVSEQFEEAIFRADKRKLTTIVSETADGFSFLGRNPSLNDEGQVSFAARLIGRGGEAILVGSGGPLTTVARTEPGPFNFFGFDTSVNNSGEVAFKAELDNFDEGLFSGSGGEVTTHYLNSTDVFLDGQQVRFGGNDSRPSINNLGDIAFDETIQPEFDSGIFVGREGSFRTVAAPDPNRSVQEPVLNDEGTAAFETSFFDETGQFVTAIVKGNGGPLTTVADTTGPFSSFSFSGPSINDGGTVAFGASLDTGESGIFVGPDPVADRVILTGEKLHGSTVTNAFVCSEGLNDAGQIVFVAQLDDGRTGVFVATPKR